MTYWADERLPAAFWERVERHPSGCWRWIGHVNRDGYGVFRRQGAHRLAAALTAPVPSSHVVDHTCHVAGRCTAGRACPHRRCVNPAHLQPVTGAENVARGNWATASAEARTPRDTCQRGHAKRPGRGCEECRRQRRSAVASGRLNRRC